MEASNRPYYIDNFFDRNHLPTHYYSTMPRGADYDDGVPRSDNAIESGEDKAHGTGKVDRDVADYKDKILMV